MEGPVVFGPVYEKYIEAVELIDAGGAFSIDDALHLEKKINELLFDKMLYNKTSTAAETYIKSKTGATEQVIRFIQEKRLLTN